MSEPKTVKLSTMISTTVGAVLAVMALLGALFVGVRWVDDVDEMKDEDVPEIDARVNVLEEKEIETRVLFHDAYEEKLKNQRVKDDLYEKWQSGQLHAPHE